VFGPALAIERIPAKKKIQDIDQFETLILFKLHLFLNISTYNVHVILNTPLFWTLLAVSHSTNNCVERICPTKYKSNE
jgi:hypothetical protein